MTGEDVTLTPAEFKRLLRERAFDITLLGFGDDGYQYYLESTGPSAQYTRVGRVGPFFTGGGSTDHDLLSATHPDTLADAVVAGDIIIGNATPKWARLPKGTNGDLLTLVAGLPAWQAPGGGSAHALLSATHTDTSPSTPPSRGAIIRGSSSSLWELLTLGLSGRVLHSDGVDAAWTVLNHSELGSVTADQHHAQVHVLDSSDHTVSGKTAGQFLRATGAAAFAFEAVPFSIVVVIESPTAGDKIAWRVPFSCTVTAVKGYQDTGTGTTFNAFKGTLASPTTFLASNGTIASADAWTDGGSVQNAALVSGNVVYVRVGAVSGSPNRVAIQVDLSRP